MRPKRQVVRYSVWFYCQIAGRSSRKPRETPVRHPRTRFCVVILGAARQPIRGRGAVKEDSKRIFNFIKLSLYGRFQGRIHSRFIPSTSPLTPTALIAAFTEEAGDEIDQATKHGNEQLAKGFDQQLDKETHLSRTIPCPV